MWATVTQWRDFLDKGQEAPCGEPPPPPPPPPEKSGLKPMTPNCLADQKHCISSTQPNPHLRRWGFGWVDEMQCFGSAGRFGVKGLSPDFSRFFSLHNVSRPLSRKSLCRHYLLSYPGQPFFFSSTVLDQSLSPLHQAHSTMANQCEPLKLSHDHALPRRGLHFHPCCHYTRLSHLGPLTAWVQEKNSIGERAMESKCAKFQA